MKDVEERVVETNKEFDEKVIEQQENLEKRLNKTELKEYLWYLNKLINIVRSVVLINVYRAVSTVER